MERDIMRQLAEWKDSPDRKPLLLTGVRQCGKTYICKAFGEAYFEDVAYFYFEGNKGLSSIFEYDFEVERIIDELGNIVRGKAIIPGKTLQMPHWKGISNFMRLFLEDEIFILACQNTLPKCNYGVEILL